uniref:Uncharacterized protein n=1 Tax=mine drainage metagenome TaxID=410659 RepID=E6PLH3_9ZZZZ
MLESIGGGTGTRTQDLLIKSQLLYQLSYTPEKPSIIAHFSPSLARSARQKMGAERAAGADGVLLTMVVENQGSAALNIRWST